MSDDETIERAALAAYTAWENAIEAADEWRDVARAVLAAAQPAPSVPAGAEVAAVLAGLVEEMRAFIGGDRSWGIYDAIALVEAAQQKAATGTDLCGDILRGEFGGPDNVCTKPVGAHEWHQQGDGVRWRASAERQVEPAHRCFLSCEGDC